LLAGFLTLNNTSEVSL